jgi:hypothetical protein
MIDLSGNCKNNKNKENPKPDHSLFPQGDLTGYGYWLVSLLIINCFIFIEGLKKISIFKHLN